MKETYYFSHDCNARNDVKILKLRRKLGMEGYGIYWALVEMLREEESYILQIKYIDEIAFSLSVDVEKLNSVIYDFELFVIEDEGFYSDRLMRSMDKYKEMLNKKSKAGQKGMKNRYENKPKLHI
jgi:uncharacterized protein YdaU (DUF1376 family)